MSLGSLRLSFRPSFAPEGVLYRAAQVYLAWDKKRALQLVAPLGRRLESEPQIYAKLIAGEAQLKKANVREALGLFQDAQKLSDSWLGRFDLGRAYLDAGLFTEASSELDICLNRRGEATSVFLDDIPSYHLFPAVYYYQGRAREGLHSQGAAESYKLFLEIKAKGSEDPLVSRGRTQAPGRTVEIAASVQAPNCTPDSLTRLQDNFADEPQRPDLIHGGCDGGGARRVRRGEPSGRGDDQVGGARRQRVECAGRKVSIRSEDYRAGDDRANRSIRASHRDIYGQAGTNILEGLKRERVGVQ